MRSIEGRHLPTISLSDLALKVISCRPTEAVLLALCQIQHVGLRSITAVARHVSNYFYCRIPPKGLLYDAERDVLATAEFLVIINFSHTVTGRTGQYSQRTLATLCMTVRQTREGIH